MDSKENAIFKWVKEHEKQLVIGGFVVCVGIIVLANKRISELKTLCLEKDDFVKSLSSELLRQGNPKGGELMASRKAYLNARAA